MTLGFSKIPSFYFDDISYSKIQAHSFDDMGYKSQKNVKD